MTASKSCLILLKQLKSVPVGAVLESRIRNSIAWTSRGKGV